jgi:hypothetical protein
VVKNAVVHSRRQEVRKSYLNGFLNYLTLFYSLGFNFQVHLSGGYVPRISSSFAPGEGRTSIVVAVKPNAL